MQYMQLVAPGARQGGWAFRGVARAGLRPPWAPSCGETGVELTCTTKQVLLIFHTNHSLHAVSTPLVTLLVDWVAYNTGNADPAQCKLG